MRIMTRRFHHTSRRGGTAAVEFALILPVLLLLVLGIWEVGRMVQVQQIISNAAREGGRQAAAGDLTNTQVIAVVRQYLEENLPAAAGNNATITVTNLTSGLDAASANQLDHFQISVTLNYNDVRWTTLNLIAGAGTTLSGTADWYALGDVPITVDTTIPLN
jgi:Flp pilus assembly protein TadG